MLHDMTPPPGGGDPFRIKWFQGVMQWRDFCLGNLVERNFPNHSFDLVIGPSCLPLGVGSVRVLQIGGFAPTQITCCTQRAWEWMALAASTIFVERH